MDLPARIKRQERLKKRQKLRSIIEAVLAGKFDSKKESLDILSNQNPPRLEYISPTERSSFNSGYMTSNEMLGIPNEG